MAPLCSRFCSVWRWRSKRQDGAGKTTRSHDVLTPVFTALSHVVSVPSCARPVGVVRTLQRPQETPPRQKKNVSACSWIALTPVLWEKNEGVNARPHSGDRNVKSPFRSPEWGRSFTPWKKWSTFGPYYSAFSLYVRDSWFDSIWRKSGPHGLEWKTRDPYSFVNDSLITRTHCSYSMSFPAFKTHLHAKRFQRFSSCKGRFIISVKSYA